MKSVGLVAVLHDERGDLLDHLQQHLSKAEGLYDTMFIALSDTSDERLEPELIKQGFELIRIPKKGAAYARREVLRFAFEHEQVCDVYHYCDLDRLVTWLATELGELKHTIAQLIGSDYVVIGRTEQAFKSHPVEWQETEQWTNHVFSLAIGERADVTAGSAGLSRHALVIIVKDLSNTKAKMTDAEWPLLVREKKGNASIKCLFVNGLCYREENRPTQTDELLNWTSRIRLAHEITTSISADYKRKLHYK